MNIFDEILSALETEEQVMLATIISTSGSTPASALSKMLVKEGGIVSVGTVGGGCMEGDVLLHANRLYGSGKAEILTFHLNEDDLEHGLICGGSLNVLIEPITRKHAPLYHDLKSLRDEGEDSILVTFLDTGGNLSGKFLIDPRAKPDSAFTNGRETDRSFNQLPSQFRYLVQDLQNIVQNVCHRRETQRMKTEHGEVIVELIPGNPGLIIFGGGHVSKYVSRAATMAGFRVTIVDDREKYANRKRFPEALQTLAIDFMEAFHQLHITASTYIIIVTRGHRFDEDILEHALATQAKYIGMIGSKRKVFTTYQHLVEKGIPLETLHRVHAPVGIEIAAVTAEEIGISIVAQLIHVRRGEQVPLQDKSNMMSELLLTFEKNPLTRK